MAAAAVEQDGAVAVTDVLQLAVFVDHDVYLARLVAFADVPLEVVRLRRTASARAAGVLRPGRRLDRLCITDGDLTELELRDQFARETCVSACIEPFTVTPCGECVLEVVQESHSFPLRLSGQS